MLEDISVTVHTGERVGLVGVNGSGKSTLVRILAGLDVPDTGEVVHRRGAAIAYLEQEPRFPEGMRAREAVLAGLGGWSEARARHLAASDARTSAWGAALRAARRAQNAAPWPRLRRSCLAGPVDSAEDH